LKIFDCATENIKLGGKRLGANRGVLQVDHPDILTFIDAKLVAGALADFNLSGREPYEKEHASKCDPYQCKL
jgi:ribonucleoside-diphosphate reductase alpha chain